MIESPRHELDEAIDRVAAKMVAAPGDDRLLPNVIARLPEREASPWFMQMRVQAAAAAALLLVAFLWARPLDRTVMPITESAERITEPAPPLVDARSAELPTPAVTEASAGKPDPQLPAVTLDRPDHEHSLAPVMALEAMVFESIAPAALEPDAAVVLAPLALSELMLAGESSPHDR